MQEPVTAMGYMWSNLSKDGLCFYVSHIYREYYLLRLFFFVLNKNCHKNLHDIFLGHEKPDGVGPAPLITDPPPTSSTTLSTMPQILGTMPHVFGTMPHIFGTMLHIFSTLPHIFDTKPHIFGTGLNFFGIIFWHAFWAPCRALFAPYRTFSVL